MILGSASAGKSSICDALRCRRFATRATSEYTIGIDITHLTLGHVQVSLWDTAGRQAYYPGHWPFMTPGALYLCVFDASELEYEQCASQLGLRCLLADQLTLGNPVHYRVGQGTVDLQRKWRVCDSPSNRQFLRANVLSFLHTVNARAPGAKIIFVGTKLDAVLAKTCTNESPGKIIEVVQAIESAARMCVENTWPSAGGVHATGASAAGALQVVRYCTVSSVTRYGIQGLQDLMASVKPSKQSIPLAYLACEKLMPHCHSATVPANPLVVQDTVAACTVCTNEFSVWSARIRYNCHWCGRVVCGDCSQRSKWQGNSFPHEATSQGQQLFSKSQKIRLCSECEAVAFSQQDQSDSWENWLDIKVADYLNRHLDTSSQDELRVCLAQAYITFFELQALDLPSRLGFSRLDGLLKGLHQAGRLLWFDQEPQMSTYVIMKPQFLLDACSSLVHDFPRIATEMLFEPNCSSNLVADTGPNVLMLCEDYLNNARISPCLFELLWSKDVDNRCVACI